MTESKSGSQDKNEGEGNQTAARAYDKDVNKFAHSGKVEPAAQDAAKSPPDTKAEEAGRRHSHGEDPALKR